MKHAAFAFASGALFGSGLAVSQMTDPAKVLAFLDVAGDWDPTLGLVMAGALAVAVPGFAWVRRRAHASACGDPLPVPARTRIDARLLSGSALFGVGWGITGLCPGPALANLAHGAPDAIAFVVAMLAGSLLARLLPAAS